MNISCISNPFFLIFSPITYALNAGVTLTNSSDHADYCVSKREYDEHGVSICHRKFLDNFE
jgi:actin-related protein